MNDFVNNASFVPFDMGAKSYINLDGVDTLYLGTILNALELSEGSKQSWAILNCTDDPSLDEFNKPGFQVRNLNHWDGFPYSGEQIRSGIDFIKTSFELNHAVLVCCHAGMSRSPGIVLAYLMSTGMEYNDAILKIRKARPIIRIHPNIDLSIRKYFHLAPRTVADLIGG